MAFPHSFRKNNPLPIRWQRGISVRGSETVGGMDADVEPTRTYSRRVSDPLTEIPSRHIHTIKYWDLIATPYIFH